MAKFSSLKSFLLFSFLFFNLCTFAQVKITGTVIDEESNPLEFVNVVLFQPDSTFLTGVTSTKNGKFTFEKVNKGDYFLTISYVGYEKTSIEINRIDHDLNLGSIKLISSELLLDDVTVTANSVIKKIDRQIIIPSKAQVNTSNNGISLLRHLQLSRITINPIENTITALGGGNVQLRLNGLEVTQAEIMAVDPKDVVRVEYHDDPGLRYNNAEAVLDFITKRKESGGNIMTSLINAISDVGWGENNLSAKYNYKKSEFSTNFYWGRRDVKWTRENYDTYVFPDKILERIEKGEPTKAKYDNLNFALNYSLMETDKYLFNIRFRDNYNNTPNSTGDRISSLAQENELLSIYDHSSAKTNTPSLDLYYQRNLKKNQLIIFNAVGTYIGSENKRTYRESIGGEDLTDIYSKINGDKYSLIAEGIYERNMQSGKISGGIKHTQTYTKNKYLGDNNSKVEMKTAETYAYVEYQFKHKKLNYMIGLGGMRTYNGQDDVSNTKYIFRPSLGISYNINDNLFLRYNGYISGYSPSLSNLNDVEQTIDSLQIRRGNPNLKTVVFYANSITAGWNKGIFGVELLAKYSYDRKPIMESLYYEDGKFIRTYENQKGFHRINVQTAFQLRPYKDIVSIMVTPWFNRQISEGNNYTHTNNNWGVRGNISISYDKWVLELEMSTRNNELWGETLKRGERFHSIIAGYNTNNWSLWGGFLNPFSKKYDVNTRNLSDIMPGKQYTLTKNLSQLFVVGFSLNLNLGRQYKSANKRLDNKDTDSGILSGSKE